MAKRRMTSGSKQTKESMESQEEMSEEPAIREERSAGYATGSTTPSSWWEERKKIERPEAEEQDTHYREEQERYGQERQKAGYYRPIQETIREEPIMGEEQTEEEEQTVREEQMTRAEQPAARRATAPTTSWWEERTRIKQPRAEEQERRYREEQERYGQERQKAGYYKPIQMTGEAEERRYRETPERPRAEGREKEDIFHIWADSYTAVSKMWEESYTSLYRPWIESAGEIYSKAAELSKNATPENYRTFYDEWMKTYQNTFGKLYQARQPDREMLDKFVASAEESRALFQSWVTMLDENLRKTQELMQGTPDPEKYRESYDTWARTYRKIFEDFVEIPTRGSTKEVLETYAGIPDIYLKNFAQLSKLWNESNMYLYRPWVDSMLALSRRMAELSRGEARPEAFREFYSVWMNTYRETYDRLFNIQSIRPASEEMIDRFSGNMNIFQEMYRSWISVLEKMSQETMGISQRTAEPEAYREAYNTWAGMYERAFDDFFRYVPAAVPMKSMLEPAKNAVKMYADTVSSISSMWMRPVFATARA